MLQNFKYTYTLHIESTDLLDESNHSPQSLSSLTLPSLESPVLAAGACFLDFVAEGAALISFRLSLGSKTRF